MKEFHYIELSELDFVRIVLKGADPKFNPKIGKNEDLIKDLRPGNLRVVWDGGQPLDGLPSYFVAEEATLKSVLSRMLALPGGITPITSIIRAWDIDDLRILAKTNPIHMSSRMAAGFIGLIVGELTHVLGSGADFRRMGLDLVRRTLTFTCAQAASRGYDDSVLPNILRRWLEASQLAGNVRDPSTAYAAVRNSAFLISATDGLNEGISPIILAQLINSWTDAIGNQGQRDLLSINAVLEHVATAVRNRSREARVDVIEEALKEIRKVKGNDLQAGFLISLIDPGSFDFFEYANRYDDGSGGVLLSYAMCAGILGGAVTFGRYHGFGMNVFVNGFKANSSSRDVSISEIGILNAAGREHEIDFRTRTPSAIDVELFPHVYGSFSKRGREKPGKKNDEIAALELAALRERVLFARQAIDAAHDALSVETESDLKRSMSNRRGKRPA